MYCVPLSHIIPVCETMLKRVHHCLSPSIKQLETSQLPYVMDVLLPLTHF